MSTTSQSAKIVWTKLSGTSSEDQTVAMTTTADGSIYVTGSTSGNLDSQINSGNFDAFLTKYNPDGTKVWTKLLGTISTDWANAITTGADGSIYISGYTAGNLDGQINSGNYDAFLTKYNANGTKIWTRLIGTSSNDLAFALTTGKDGSIYVSGETRGNLDGQINSGNYDTFLTKYDPNGTKLWTKLLGTNAVDVAFATTTGIDGAIYISGRTEYNLDGQINQGGNDAFLTKYNSDGTKAWTKLFGASGEEYARALTTSSDGSIYLSGYTGSSIEGLINSGGNDGFLSKYDSNGAKIWTTLFGSSSNDLSFAITTDNDGSIYVSGHTEGNLDGQISSGSYDAFLIKYDPKGTKLWTKLFGTSLEDYSYALAIGVDGAIFLSGFTNGNLNGQINSGNYDNFLIKLLVVDNILPTTVTTENFLLSIIVNRGVLGTEAVLLKDLKESFVIDNGLTTNHTIEYAGLTFDYNLIDSLITTVTRNGEFTSEFTKEINDYLKTELNITYSAAVALVGSASIDGVILSVAGADGNFVG
jgi:uncharacterized delta-60 repeat protein